MKKIVCIALFVMLGSSLVALAGSTAPGAEAIEKVVVRSYLHGAFNELDPEAMRQGFHPDFAIYSADGEKIKKYPIETWADGVEKRKADPEFDAAKNKWDYTIRSIDVTGGAAAVKIELMQNDKLVYTDYLSLLKFDSGWRIVAKVYHRHE